MGEREHTIRAFDQKRLANNPQLRKDTPMKKALSVLALTAVLGACSTVQSTVAKVEGDLTTAITKGVAFTEADLKTAQAAAIASGDTMAATCWGGALTFIKQLPPLPVAGTVQGAASTIQGVRQVTKASPGLQALEIACGPMLVDMGIDIVSFANQLTAIGSLAVVP